MISLLIHVLDVVPFMILLVRLATIEKRLMSLQPTREGDLLQKHSEAHRLTAQALYCLEKDISRVEDRFDRFNERGPYR